MEVSYTFKGFCLTTLSSKQVLDIHAGNILFCIPDTLQLDSDSFKPLAYEVTKYNGGPIDQGVPTHYVESMVYTEEDCEELTEVKLVDFSNGRLLKRSIIWC